MKKINNDMPLVSVIIPVYNRQGCIEDTVKNTLKQTLDDIEIICVDDGSSDGTWDVLLRLTEFDNRVRVFHKENGGAGSARNMGIEESKGEFLFFLDSDDSLCDRNVLRTLYNAAKENDASVCGGKLLIENSSGIIIAEETKMDDGFVEFEDYQKCYYFTRFIYSRRMIVDSKIQFPRISDYEDPVFFVNVMLAAKRFFHVDIDVYLYNHRHQDDNRINLNTFKDRLRGITRLLQISRDNQFEKLHHKMYMALIDCAEKNGYDFLPSDDLELFKVLISANEAIDNSLLEKSGSYHKNSDVLPVLQFIWSNSNKYQMLRKGKVFSLIKKK